MSRREHSVALTLLRRLTDHLRLTLEYGFCHYGSAAFGGHRDYEAHLVYSGLQHCF
jgi:hypothetical protein